MSLFYFKWIVCLHNSLANYLPKLLAYCLKNNKDYEINLIFSNNAHIALTTETIEARLEDQNEILDKWKY